MTDPPRPDFPELADYTGVLRRRGWIALALAGLGALVSVIYLAVAPARYQATADVYVTPNSANQNVVLGSKGTSTAVNMDNEAQIVESNTVAVLAAAALHSGAYTVGRQHRQRDHQSCRANLKPHETTSSAAMCRAPRWERMSQVLRVETQSCVLVPR